MGMDLTVGRHGRKGPRPEMNVTPLVDVVLVLLIVFMVITPLLSKQFWINLPVEERNEQAPPPTAGDGPVVVSVDKAGVVRINREVVAKDQLAHKLRRVLAARGDRAVFFDAAEDATYESAVQVLDLARGGGASTIAILTRPMPGT